MASAGAIGFVLNLETPRRIFGDEAGQMGERIAYFSDFLTLALLRPLFRHRIRGRGAREHALMLARARASGRLSADQL